MNKLSIALISSVISLIGVHANAQSTESIHGQWDVKEIYQNNEKLDLNNIPMSVIISDSSYAFFNGEVIINLDAKFFPTSESAGKLVLSPITGVNAKKSFEGSYERADNTLTIKYAELGKNISPNAGRIIILDSRDKPPFKLNKNVFENSIGMTFKYIMPSTFTMGAKAGEPSRLDEAPRRVTITRPYLIGAHEVTVKQFSEFVAYKSSQLGKPWKTEAEGNDISGGFTTIIGGENKWVNDISWRDPGFPQSEKHPVVLVSWNDAKLFCEWLSKKENLNYRLPTEAEWELAAKAGRMSTYSWGMEAKNIVNNANFADKSYSDAFPKRSSSSDFDDGYVYTAPVGNYQPNNFGIYDMHGNVFEWTKDSWAIANQKIYIDPTGPAEGEYKVAKGGAFGSRTDQMRIGYRFRDDPKSRFTGVGFRVVLETN